MAKAMSKEAQIAALRETNGSLEADVMALSEAVGELEAEIVTERATAARLVQEAQAKVVEALTKTAGDAAADLTVQVEWLKGVLEASKAETAKLQEALKWAEGGLAEAEAEGERQVKFWRDRADDWEGKHDELIEAHRVELLDARQKLKAEHDETVEQVEKEANKATENMRDALDTYLADLGYPRDPHPSTITCPSLRRLVTEIN